MMPDANPISITLPGGIDGAEAMQPRPPSLDIPELGMKGHRFHSPTLIVHTVPWRDRSNSHLYELRIVRNPADTDWMCTALNDGHEVFSLFSPSHFGAERCGIAAFKAYLIRGHRRTWRKARRKAAADPAEMTVRDAIKIVRQEAAKNTGDIRAALTMLADLAEERQTP